MKWKPNVRSGAWIGGGIILFILLVDGGLLWRTVYGPLNGVSFVCALLSFLSLPAIGMLGYRIYELMQLRYEFDRNQLAIITAATKQIIPMGRIERVIDGRSVEQKPRMRGLAWPGYFFGRGQIEGIGLVLFYAVSPPSEQAIIVTPTLAYGISVPDMETFVDVFHAHQRIGASVEVKQESHLSPYVHWPIWGDHTAQAILLGTIAVNVLLFGILCFRYPELPNLLPLHYDIEGRVDRIAPRNQVFVLPVVGLITLIVNGALGGILYRRERMASMIAWSGALLVQVLFLLALSSLVG